MTGFPLAMAVAAAGAIGCVVRYLIDLGITKRFTALVAGGTLTVNIVGSFVFGLVTGLIAHHHLGHLSAPIIGTGFCGGLTTASSAAFESARLYRLGHRSSAIFVTAGGITLSCAAAAVGLGLALF
jgi:CrcB protein